MPKKEKLPKQKKPPKQAKHVKQQKKRKGRSVQDFIGVKTFTKYGLMTQKGELLFYLVSPTNISVLSYVWGTYGQVLTRSLYKAKAEQYPDEVGGYADFIEEHWIGGRTADCVGLIKGYGWFDPETGKIEYGTNGMPDIGADTMYANAEESGTIDTIPEIPGLAVWHEGHIGIYIGNGQVIHASGTKVGVIQTPIENSGWTHWLKIPYITYYDSDITEAPDEAHIWEVLYAKIGNPYGVAGLMGNLYAESGLMPNNLQNSYEESLGYSDASYTQAVDSGSYTNFTSDSAGCPKHSAAAR